MKPLPALLLLTFLHVPGTHAEALGRLFFTPEQRTQLEYRHAYSTTADGRDTPAMLLINGIVQRHGGARTVWINGTAQNSAHGGEPATETIAVPGTRKTIRIKVGQKLLLDTEAPPRPYAPAE